MKKSNIKSNLSGDAKRWSEDIAKWRAKKGYSQKKLAELVGLGIKAVGDWEREGKIPHERTRDKLSCIFNAKVTSKGIIENHIDMNSHKETPHAGVDPTEKDWYKKTIESLIHQNGNNVDRLSQTVEKTVEKLHARDQAEIEDLKREKSLLWQEKAKSWEHVDALKAHFQPPQNGQQ